jgi:hypothetical protein
MAQPNGLWPVEIPSRHFSIANCISSAGVMVLAQFINVNLAYVLLYEESQQSTRVD